MAKWIRREAAPTGSTGNNTHPGIEIDPSIDVSQLLLEFIVEAIGATPTVTYKWQVAPEDPGNVPDANATWVDLNYILWGDTTEAVVAATRARTTASTDTVIPFLGTKAKQIFRRIRLVTSANTNVTYRAVIAGLDTSG